MTWRERRRRWAKVVSEIARTPRPIEIALAVLALFIVFIYGPMRLTFGRAQVESSGVAASSDAILTEASNAVDPNGVLSLPTPPYVAQLVGHDEISRNPFNYKTPTPTPRPPTPTPRPVTPVPSRPPVSPTVTPTPTPTPYSTPLSLIGLAESPAHRIAFLKAEDAIFYAVVGDLLLVKEKTGNTSKHRILDIDLDKVKVGPETGTGEVVLKLKDETRR